MRELQRKLEHDIKLKEFFAVKGNQRVNAELEAREANRKLQQQELSDKQLADLQDIMKQIQVNASEQSSRILYFKSSNFCQKMYRKCDKIPKETSKFLLKSLKKLKILNAKQFVTANFYFIHSVRNMEFHSAC